MHAGDATLTGREKSITTLPLARGWTRPVTSHKTASPRGGFGDSGRCTSRLLWVRSNPVPSLLNADNSQRNRVDGKYSFTTTSDLFLYRLFRASFGPAARPGLLRPGCSQGRR